MNKALSNWNIASSKSRVFRCHNTSTSGELWPSITKMWDIFEIIYNVYKEIGNIELLKLNI